MAMNCVGHMNHSLQLLTNALKDAGRSEWTLVHKDTLIHGVPEKI